MIKRSRVHERPPTSNQQPLAMGISRLDIMAFRILETWTDRCNAPRLSVGSSSWSDGITPMEEQLTEINKMTKLQENDDKASDSELLSLTCLTS